MTLPEIMAGNVAVDFMRVSYDVDKAAKAIVSSGPPEYFAERLREDK